MKETVKVKLNVSNCCGGNMNILITENGPDYMDLNICPKCKEHCSTTKS